MTDSLKSEQKEKEKKIGINFFNKTWNLIEKENRTPEEDELMLHYAHASRLHWELSECPKVNIQRGDWMVAKIYCLLKRPKSALIYAKFCLDNTEDPTKDNNFKDFDVAYGNEMMARSNACANDKEEFEKYFKLAKEAGEKISDKGDKYFFVNDLDNESWFGMK